MKICQQISPASLKQEPGSDSKSEILFNILIPHLPAMTHPAYAGALPVFTDDFSELLNMAVLQMQKSSAKGSIAATKRRYAFQHFVC